MKRNVIIVGIVVVVAAGLAAYYHFRDEMLTADTLKRAAEVQKKIDQEKEASLATDKTASTQAATKAEPTKTEPTAASDNVFRVKFECSNGTFIVECHRDWAPIGAARFEELVKSGFFNGDRFFRVLPGFVVQFGLNGDPAVSKKWVTNTIKDEPVKQSNTTGMLVFAKTGAPNSRTTQLFINLDDNRRLDRMGFSPFAKVVEGMDVVKAITAQYGEDPKQYLIESQGNAYLEKSFPKLDYVKTATIVK